MFRAFTFATWHTANGRWPGGDDEDVEEGWVLVSNFSEVEIFGDEHPRERIQEALDCVHLEEMTTDDWMVARGPSPDTRHWE